MPRKRYSTEQIVTKLRQAEVELGGGLRTPEMCKKLGVSEQTYYSLAERVRRLTTRPSQAAQGSRAPRTPASGRNPADGRSSQSSGPPLDR